MPDDRLITTRELVGATGVPEITVKRAAADRALMPHVRGRGRRPDRYRRVQALGLAVARYARGRGSEVPEAGGLLDCIGRMSEAELEAHFEAGRRYILIVGTRPLPRLIRLEDAGADPGMVAACWKSGIVPCLIDVSRAWERLQERIAQLRAEETCEQAAR
jgi:hypothetical protein